MQAKLKAYLEGLGYTDASESKDRNYFHSVYCRSPGGILTEFATTDIGFTTDEKLEELGTSLLLPPWFEVAPGRDRRAARADHGARQQPAHAPDSGAYGGLESPAVPVQHPVARQEGGKRPGDGRTRWRSAHRSASRKRTAS